MPIATTRTWWLFEVNLCTMSHNGGYTFLQPPYYQNTLRLLLAQKATFMWRFCRVALIVGCIVLYTWSVWLGIVSTTLASCIFCVAAACEKLSSPQNSRLVMLQCSDVCIHLALTVGIVGHYYCDKPFVWGTTLICSHLCNLVFNAQQQNTDIPYLV